MSLDSQHIQKVGFVKEEMPRFTKIELDYLNEELEQRLRGLQPMTDSWFYEAKKFHDYVSKHKKLMRDRIKRERSVAIKLESQAA